MEVSLWLVSATFTILVATTILILIRIFTSSSKMKWPSGPKKLPIIGNLHQLGGDVLHVTMANLAKVHGGVMTVWMGSWQPIIVISDNDIAWEVLVTKSSDFGARFPDFISNIMATCHFISGSDVGAFWQTLRKGLQSGSLGPLNIAAQSQFQERDMKRLIHAMMDKAANNNYIVKPLEHIKKNSVRLLTRLIFGLTFDDEKFLESMLYEVNDIFRIAGFARLAEVFYYAKYLPSHRKAIREANLWKLRVEKLVRPLLSSSPPKNSYLYFLLSQNLEENIVISCIFEMYSLGVDSTTNTTIWALAYLIHEQAIQEKLYQETRMTLGDVDLVRAEDVSKLKYLQAVVKETMRMKPIAPFAIPHKTTKDTTLMGTKVAEGTGIMVNLYALHYNSDIWTEPYKFIPERFMEGEDGQRTTNKGMVKSFLPFGAGMRICGGIDLAKLQVPFVVANLVNAFKWSCVEEGKFPDLSENLFMDALLLMKTPLEAKITPRKC